MINQPAEGQAGLDDKELFQIAQTSGAGTDEVKGCIQNKSFASYIEQHTQKVLNTPQQGIQVTGTPTILVNGTQFTWATGDELVSPEVFAQFVQTASAE
jgi:protein-disulfide isomerase